MIAGAKVELINNISKQAREFQSVRWEVSNLTA